MIVFYKQVGKSITSIIVAFVVGLDAFLTALALGD
jgi:hypothetical protein